MIHLAAAYFSATSTIEISCPAVSPVTPIPAITAPSFVRGTPPPIAQYLHPETVPSAKTGCPGLHQRKKVNRPHPHKRGRIGFPLGELHRKGRRSTHPV